MQISLRDKAVLYMLILILGFILFDLLGLKAIYAQLLASDLDEVSLNHLRRALFKLFMFKGLWLMISIGLGIGFGYWALKPYLKSAAEKDSGEDSQA